MIGITECGDAGLDFSWENKLHTVEFAIIISKNLNDKLIDKLVKHQDKIIFHLTCTGFGGTVLEQNVPRIGYSYNKCYDLISAGFPVKQIVLRVDPIIPTVKGRSTAQTVLTMFESIGIKRVRYSFIDMYPHVVARFAEAELPHPYLGSFSPSQSMVDNTLAMFKQYEDYEFESCAENTKDKRGCISQKDADILGITIDVGHPSFKQRTTCLCPNKVQLLPFKGGRCAHKCLYCFWK